MTPYEKAKAAMRTLVKALQMPWGPEREALLKENVGAIYDVPRSERDQILAELRAEVGFPK